MKKNNMMWVLILLLGAFIMLQPSGLTGDIFKSSTGTANYVCTYNSEGVWKCGYNGGVGTMTYATAHYYDQTLLQAAVKKSTGNLTASDKVVNYVVRMSCSKTGLKELVNQNVQFSVDSYKIVTSDGSANGKTFSVPVTSQEETCTLMELATWKGTPVTKLGSRDTTFYVFAPATFKAATPTKPTQTTTTTTSGTTVTTTPTSTVNLASVGGANNPVCGKVVIPDLIKTCLKVELVNEYLINQNYMTLLSVSDPNIVSASNKRWGSTDSEICNKMTTTTTAWVQTINGCGCQIKPTATTYCNGLVAEYQRKAGSPTTQLSGTTTAPTPACSCSDGTKAGMCSLGSPGKMCFSSTCALESWHTCVQKPTSCSDGTSLQACSASFVGKRCDGNGVLQMDSSCVRCTDGTPAGSCGSNNQRCMYNGVFGYDSACQPPLAFKEPTAPPAIPNSIQLQNGTKVIAKEDAPLPVSFSDVAQGVSTALSGGISSGTGIPVTSASMSSDDIVINDNEELGIQKFIENNAIIVFGGLLLIVGAIIYYRRK